MKLPFSFSLKFVFRLLLPGFIVSTSLLPVLKTLLDRLHYGYSLEYAFTVSIIFVGWLFIVLDMPIYMAFEGRRYWPKWLWTFFKRQEEKRLQSLLQKNKSSQETDHRTYIETSVEMRYFPMNELGQYQASSPTRVGNLITSYEDYPFRVYGMDSVFYWYRLWLSIDEDLREHIDSQQAMVDSAIYTATALIVSGVFLLIYASHQLLGLEWIEHLQDTPLLFALSILSFLGCYFVYRSSIFLHAQFGETFKSLFDTHRNKVSVEDIIDEIVSITGDPTHKVKSSKEKYMIAWRYLHNYRLRIGDRVISPPEFFGRGSADTATNEKQYNEGVRRK